MKTPFRTTPLKPETPPGRLGANHSGTAVGQRKHLPNLKQSCGVLEACGIFNSPLKNGPRHETAALSFPPRAFAAGLRVCRALIFAGVERAPHARHNWLIFLTVAIVLCGLGSGVRAATTFIQPVNLAYSASSSINSPAVLVGNVTSETGSHPNQAGGGGGTSWYASNWVGQFLSFDFASPSPLLSFHLWDYYDHSAESYQLVLYDELGGGGNVLLDQTYNINPNTGGNAGPAKRWDFTFASQIVGVESGRLYLLGPDTSGSYPNAGLSEIGFTAPELPATHWLGESSGLWTTLGNWATDATGTPAGAVPASTDDITFSATGAANQNTTLGADFTIKSLTISDTAAVTIGGANTLTISATNAITVNSGAGLFTISSTGLVLSGVTPTITVNNTAGMLLSNNLDTSTASLTKAGTGTLTLTGANTYAGGTTISGGTLQIGNGGTTGSILGNVTNNSALVFNRSNDLTFGGTISGTGSLTKEGAGILTLTAASYTGATNVNAGKLTLQNYGSFNSSVTLVGNATVEFNGGVSKGVWPLSNITFSGAGTLLKSGAGTMWLSGVGGPGNGATVNMSAGGLIDIQGGSIANDNLNVGWNNNEASMNIANGAAFDIRGQDTTIDALTGSGTVGNSILIGTNTLTVGVANGSGTFSGTIIGNGSQPSPNLNAGVNALLKTGTGTQILSSANTYSGGTNISGGTLRTQNASALGSGPVALNSGILGAVGTLNIDSLNWTGGNVELAPAADDIVNVNNAFTNGGAGGAYNIDFTGLTPGTYTLTTFATTDFTVGQFSATIVNNPNPAVQFQSLFLLNANNVQITILGATVTGNQLHNTENGIPTFGDYSATGTAVSGLTPGGVQEPNTVINSLTINPGASLNVPGPNTLSVTGNANMNGGALNVNGTMNVGGNFTDPNSAITVNGLMTVGGNVLIEGNSVLNVTSTGTFITGGNTTISDSTANIAGLYRTGGSLDLTGHSLLDIKAGGRVEVGGATNINSGSRAIVNGVFQSPRVNVNHGGWLQGSGLVIGDVLNRGTVAPGNSIGTLTIDGDYRQFHNGTLQIEISGRRFDVLVVSGTARLAGRLDVRSLGAKLAYGDQYPFLRAGRIVGKFDRIEMPRPSLYRGRFLAEGGTGILLVAPTSYTLVATNANQRSLAKALDHWIGTEDGDIGEVTLALDVQTEEQYPGAFDAISPAYYAVLPRVSIEETISQNKLLGQRMSALRAGARGVSISGMPQATTPLPSTKNPKNVSKEPMMVQAEDDRWGAFVQLSGQFADLEGFPSLADNSFDNASALVGMDYRVTDRLILGLSAGYGYTELDYDAGDDALIEDGRLTAYATFALGHGFWLQGTVGGAFSSYEVDRPVRFSFIDRTADGETEGRQFYTSIELGKDIHAGRWTVTPSTGFQFTHLSVNGFTETNAGALNLTVEDFNAESYRFHAGLQVSYETRLTDKIKATPYAHASWQHEFSDQSTDIRASLAGAGSFDWKTHSTGRDRILAGAGVVFAVGRRTSVNIGYQADFGDEDYESHLVFAQVSVGL